MIRLQVALCLILSLFFLACSKEENKTTGITCDGSNLTYNSGIASIINSNCTSSNCHGNNSSVGDFTSYNGLKTVINNGQFNSTVLVSKSMPRGSKLSDSQLSKLKCWVDNGYPEK
ncbi:MAG: hypothetical protein KDD41_00845 [Flavobacteriales bacterium]|nr:hypothetical protein [Flavobacteriales bacterium]